MTYLQLLHRFLKINNVHKSFFSYVNKVSYNKYVTSYRDLINLFITQFYWSETKEGFEFWQNISSKWSVLVWEERYKSFNDNVNITIINELHKSYKL